MAQSGTGIAGYAKSASGRPLTGLTPGKCPLSVYGGFRKRTVAIG
jgi:hypothetical protein